MTNHRTPLRRAALAATAACAALGCTVLAVPGATAAPAAHPSARALAATAQQLTRALGPNTAAGSYLDHGRLVVNLVDGRGAQQVRAAGAVARTVHRSTAQLRAATAALNKDARIPGTAWSTDVRSNQVRITADRTVGKAEFARLTKVAHRLGDAVAVHRTGTELKPYIAGGDPIWGSGYRCSLGFNVTVGGQPYFLTAGHCGNDVQEWSETQGGPPFATTAASTFPGSDYSIAQYTDTGVDHPSAVDVGGSLQPITQAGDAQVGEQVERSGSTTGVQSGQVTGLDATVNYQEGTVSGLIDTTVCAEPGDSGGSLFDGSTALGLTSGGSGDCTSGGETFFQPVTEALQAYGATIG